MTKKTKSNLILFTILAVLIIALLIWKNPFATKSNQAETEKLIDDLQGLKTIEITKADQTTTLTKQNDTWVVASEDNAIANKALITDFIEILNKVKTGTVVSDNPEKLDNFGLSDDRVINLKLTNDQDNTIIELLVGKLGGPAYNKTYVKNINSDKILLVDANLINKVNQQDWKQPPQPEEETKEESTAEIPEDTIE